jgi:hypothetical protein
VIRRTSSIESNRYGVSASSRQVRLKRSMKACCSGLPGRMKRIAMPSIWHHSVKA